jgi:hypothetical protein
MCIIVKINKTHQHLHHPRCMCIIVEINKTHQHVHHPRCALWFKIKKMERERERERDQKLGEVRDPNVKWGPPECGKWGVGTILLLLCKEVSVLQQDCVYIEKLHHGAIICKASFKIFLCLGVLLCKVTY